MRFTIINGQEWLVNCDAQYPRSQTNYRSKFYRRGFFFQRYWSINAYGQLTWDKVNTMCTESIVKYESYKRLRQAWRVQYCDGELAVRVFYSCSSASSRSLPEERNVEKGDRWILYLEICLNPECCSCSAQPLAEWSSGCMRMIEWWCVSVLGRLQCLLTVHGQPNLTRAGTDGGTLWHGFCF